VPLPIFQHSVICLYICRLLFHMLYSSDGSHYAHKLTILYDSHRLCYYKLVILCHFPFSNTLSFAYTSAGFYFMCCIQVMDIMILINCQYLMTATSVVGLRGWGGCFVLFGCFLRLMVLFCLVSQPHHMSFSVKLEIHVKVSLSQVLVGILVF
jgi:hypothetical protein